MQKKEEEEKFDYFLFSGLIIVLIVVLGILSFYSFLQQKPEYFSQVYLEPENLVSKAEQGKDFAVVFFIDNKEEKNCSYTYKISAEEELKKEGKISVEKGKVQRIEEKISFSSSHEEKQKVLIEVRNSSTSNKYSLWFWVEVK